MSQRAEIVSFERPSSYVMYRHSVDEISKPKQLSIGQLHDDVILLQLPESLSLLFSCAN